MKKIIFIITLLVIPVMLVKANSISSIEMDVYVDRSGNAIITETWYADVNTGTEGYHPYFNIGNSKINILSASMDGEKYYISNNWNIESNLETKAYKAGIYTQDDETDVCFGLTNYGEHKYEVKYQITNFVLTLSDADMVYWTLFPYDFSAAPDNVYIKLHSDFYYDSTFEVRGYGNNGTITQHEGYIEMNSNGTLNSDEYMTMLIKFPKGTFNTLNISNEEFNYYYEMAEEGSKPYVGGNEKITVMNLIVIFSFFIFLTILIIFLKNRTAKYDFGVTGNKIRKDILPFRDIPCNKDVFRAYFVAEKYNLLNKKEELLGAILLKWLNNNNVKINNIEKKKLFGSETKKSIVMVNNSNLTGEELTLYNWMFEASKDGILEENEFKDWCRKNYSSILKWFDDVIDYETNILINEGKITKFEKGTGIFKSTKYLVEPSMMIEAEQMAGLKKFLHEFSRIQDKQPIEVKLWNEYLIYAQIFGLAKEVTKQFKKLYPEISDYMRNSGYNFDDISFIYVISNSGISTASSVSYSSSGGGGGSFGGGGGGGGFR